tara:strand:- start:7637 stop:8017 length:381 start_codon:yes stop_codon:yes gene_type:complete
MKFNQLSKGFGKFLIVGIFWTGLYIFLAWFLIDLMGIYAAIASVIIVIMGLVLRFYLYVLMRLIKKEFLKFVSANLLFSVLTVVLMTITIDMMKIPTLIVSPIIIGVLFILKFIFFIKIKLIAPLP